MKQFLLSERLLTAPRAECPEFASNARRCLQLYERCTRLSDGSCFAVHMPGRHSRAGRTGRGANPPPQFGQTLASLFSAQSAQNVHS
jgi:hypothetical protein